MREAQNTIDREAKGAIDCVTRSLHFILIQMICEMEKHKSQALHEAHIIRLKLQHR